MELVRTHDELNMELCRTHHGLNLELVRTYYGLIMNSLWPHMLNFTFVNIYVGMSVC